MIGLSILLAAVYFYFSKRRYLSIFLLFCLVTAGFQLLPLSLAILPQAGISKPYDWAYIFIGAVFLCHPRVYLISPVWHRFRVVVAYCGVLLLLFIYSIFFREIEVSVSVRVLRNFFIVIVLFIFVTIPLADYPKIFKLIVYATCVASVLYCIQSIVHVSLLNKISSEMFDPENGFISRYYNVPVYIYPVIFFLFFPKDTFDIKCRPLLLIIATITVLLTQHRNMILAIGTCYIIYKVLSNEVKRKNIVIYPLMGMIFFFLIDHMMNQRFTDGLENLSSLSTATKKTEFRNIDLSDLTTSDFRKLIFEERFEYIVKEHRLALGVGLMTDDSEKAKAFNFHVGIPDDEGNISQISNVDIVWAPMILQFGLFGTLSFIIFHFTFLHKFYALRSNRTIRIGLLYLVSLFITSFYGSMIAMPYVSCLLMLFAGYYYQLSKNTRHEISL